MTTFVQPSITDIRAVNNMEEGNVMRMVFDLGKQITTEVGKPLFNFVECNTESTGGLQDDLLSFFRYENLYKTPDDVQNVTSLTTSLNGLETLKTKYGAGSQWRMLLLHYLRVNLPLSKQNRWCGIIKQQFI